MTVYEQSAESLVGLRDWKRNVQSIAIKSPEILAVSAGIRDLDSLW